MVVVVVGGVQAEDIAGKLGISGPIYQMDFDTEPKLVRKIQAR